MLRDSEEMYGVRIVRDRVYAETPTRPLMLDLALPDPPPDGRLPTVLFLHGGGWYTGDKDPTVNHFLAARGYATASAQYRFSREARFPASIHDVKAAVRWLRLNADAYHIDPDRIGVWGHSAGGHMAAFLGTSAGLAAYEGAANPGADASVQAVMTVSAITWLLDGKPRPADSPTGRLLGAPPADVPDLARTFSPVTHIRPGQDLPPFLILHGSADRVVWPRHAEFLYDALNRAGADVTYIPVSGGDHLLTGQWAVVEHLALHFFDRVLGGGGVSPRVYRNYSAEE
ncbi:MAG: alpha/beta hydrolase fold domain-containing protein [Phototrophicaceae bacterium]